MINRHFLRSFIKSNRGNTLIEFALVLPVMIILLMGIFEVTMYAFLHNKLVRIAGTTSSVVSMQNISRDKLIAIMDTAERLASPFNFAANGGIVVTHVRNDGETDNPANMLISWQETKGSFLSHFGGEGDVPTNLPADIDVLDDEAVILTEVFYNYEPLVFKNFIDSQQLYKTALYVPRFGNMYPLVGEEN